MIDETVLISVVVDVFINVAKKFLSRLPTANLVEPVVILLLFLVITYLDAGILNLRNPIIY